MGVDVGQAGLNFGDAMRIVRVLGLGEKGGALGIRGEHHVDQAFGTIGRFLRQLPDAPARRLGDAAAFGGEIAANRFEQGRFAGAVASHQADARPRSDLDVSVLDE